jgi:hypothetical protein
VLRIDLWIWTTFAHGADANLIPLRGKIRDAVSGELIPARLSVQSADRARWYFVKSSDPRGGAIDVLNGVAPRAPRVQIESQFPINKLEFVVNGDVVVSRAVTSQQRSDKHSSPWREAKIGRSKPKARAGSSLAASKRPSGRVRFAHTAPWYFDQPSREIRPHRTRSATRCSASKRRSPAIASC